MNPRTNPNLEKQETYREQVLRLARSLAAGNDADVIDDLAAGSTLARVKLFTDGNLDKRFEKLQRELEFIALAFDRCDDLIEAYMRSVPLAAYETGASDGDRFLEWLELTQQPRAEQRDYIACQRARHAVEDAARAHRLGHIRFQELLSVSDSLQVELETNRSLAICLNPIRIWTHFETDELLDDSAAVPATVVFFPVGTEIRTAMLEGNGLERVRELAAFGPCTLDAWQELLSPFAGYDEVPRRSLVSVCRQLAEIGLVAFA